MHVHAYFYWNSWTLKMQLQHIDMGLQLRYRIIYHRIHAKVYTIS
jgi:hypothetical protein